ncbi:MAG: hypothetical protein ACE5DQ_02990 [Candidatus Paceibacterota bacterium]
MIHSQTELLELLGFTLDIIGKVMVSYTVLMVHYRVWKDHKVDEEVFKQMGSERIIGFVGIALMIAGYAVHILSRLL